MSDQSIALKARWVFPVESPPLRDAVVVVQGNGIVSVGNDISAGRVRDLGNVALLPGLVNAHTHLEFSGLKSPLLSSGSTFTEWIRAVVDWRRLRDSSTHAVGPEAIHLGLAESMESGTMLLGEIATQDWPAKVYDRAEMRVTVFRELLGSNTGMLSTLMSKAQRHLDPSSRSDEHTVRGISPHAPYTVSWPLVERLAMLSRETRTPIAMHLAESTEELELLRSHSGPLVDLLSDLEAWEPASIPRGIEPGAYLQALSQSHRALIIHGNYLTDSEVNLLSSHAGRMSLIFCPRTHAYFGHPRYPLTRRLAQGIHVALGTDSRASNPDLSVFREMSFIARHYQDVDPTAVLALGTIEGARALGRDNDSGSLLPGKRADIVAVTLPEHETHDPYELLFDGDGQVHRIECGNAVGTLRHP